MREISGCGGTKGQLGSVVGVRLIRRITLACWKIALFKHPKCAVVENSSICEDTVDTENFYAV